MNQSPKVQNFRELDRLYDPYYNQSEIQQERYNTLTLRGFSDL